ncbi:1,2-dihydroxy-3-keto-5-methylthiopentene dioxygenase, partial [Lachnellula suecica]
GDGRLPHDSGVALSTNVLASLGILYYNLPVDVPSSAEELNEIAKVRGYSSRDELTISPETMGPVYEGMLKKFFTEHLHQDEEIRYLLKGGGYFDVRDADDKWIRMKVEPGDMIILPAGIYHRFTLDDSDYGGVIRLFKENPKWEALNRGAESDEDEYRKSYLLARSKGFSE